MQNASLSILTESKIEHHKLMIACQNLVGESHVLVINC